MTDNPTSLAPSSEANNADPGSIVKKKKATVRISLPPKPSAKQTIRIALPHTTAQQSTLPKPPLQRIVQNVGQPPVASRTALPPFSPNINKSGVPPVAPLQASLVASVVSKEPLKNVGVPPNIPLQGIPTDNNIKVYEHVKETPPPFISEASETEEINLKPPPKANNGNMKQNEVNKENLEESQAMIVYSGSSVVDFVLMTIALAVVIVFAVVMWSNLKKLDSSSLQPEINVVETNKTPPNKTPPNKEPPNKATSVNNPIQINKRTNIQNLNETSLNIEFIVPKLREPRRWSNKA